MTLSRLRLPLAGLLALSGACSSAVPRQSGLITTTEIQASNDQVRIFLYNYARYMGVEVSRAADSIIMLNQLHPHEHQTLYRRRAIQWKIQLFNQAMATLAIQDPLLAMADLWAMGLQQEEFFTSGVGSELFGPHQPIATQAAQRIAQRGTALVEQMTDHPAVDTTESFVAVWARDHPLKHDISGRETIVPELALRLDAGGMSAFGAVGDMAQRLANISDRLSVYVNAVPQSTIWQVDLLLDRTLETNPHIVSLRDSIASLSNNVGRVAGTLEHGSPIIDTLRMALRQEVALLVAGVIDSVEVLRLAAFNDIALERVRLIAALGNERAAVMLGADSLAQAAVARATSGLRSLLWLAVLLVLLFLMVPLAVGFLLGRSSRLAS